jgi:hypothetical protein
MLFVMIAMEARSFDVRVGSINFSKGLAGEIGWESLPPELVLEFGFSFGLGCGSIKETDVVECERPGQLGGGLGGYCEKNA